MKRELLVYRIIKYIFTFLIKIKTINLNYTYMSKTLKLDENTAKRLYPTASNEFKELLEQNFTKEFFKPKPITEQIEDYQDVCDILGVDDSDESIKIEVPGFDRDQINIVRAVIKKLRVVEVYNGKKKISRGENRWYPWYRLASGSGLDFNASGYSGDLADTSSAARLAFLSEHTMLDFVKKFKYLDEQIIDL